MGLWPMLPPALSHLLSPMSPKASPKKKISAKPAAAGKKVPVKKTVSGRGVPKAPTLEKVSEKKEVAKTPPRIRIRLSAFDHTVLDDAARKIIDTSERAGAVVRGPIPLPTRIRKFTVQRATFKFKDARDQFEMRTHRRLIDLTETTFKTMDALQNLSLPSGVDIEIKMMS